MGTEPSFTVTADNFNKTLCVKVTVKGYNGEAAWEAISAVEWKDSVSSVTVVDGKDGFTEVTIPRAGQVLRANIKCSDGTEIGSYPVNADAAYTWYSAENPESILGTEPSLTVTSENVGDTICVKVTVYGYKGEAVWSASEAVPAFMQAQDFAYGAQGDEEFYNVGFQILGVNNQTADDVYASITQIEVKLFADGQEIANRVTVKDDGKDGIAKLKADDQLIGGYDGQLSAAFVKRDAEESNEYWVSSAYDFTEPDCAAIIITVGEGDSEIVYRVENSDLYPTKPGAAIDIPAALPEVTAADELYTSKGGLIENFDSTGLPSVEISLKKGAEEANVRMVIDADENTKAHVQAIAKETVGAGAGRAWNVIEAGWGAAEGFPIADATTTVYLVADQAGTYTATIKLIDVSTGDVLASKEMSMTVKAQQPSVVFGNGDAADVGTINVPDMEVAIGKEGDFDVITFTGAPNESDLADLTECPSDDPDYESWANDVAFTYAYFRLPEGANYLDIRGQASIPYTGLVRLEENNADVDGMMVEIDGQMYYKMAIQFAHQDKAGTWYIDNGNKEGDNDSIVEYNFTVGSVEAGKTPEEGYKPLATYHLRLDYSGLTLADVQ